MNHPNSSAIDGLREVVSHTRDGIPPVELKVEWYIQTDSIPVDEDYPDTLVKSVATLGIQRDCDPTKVAIYTLLPDDGMSVAGYYLTEEQALALATGLMVALAACPEADDDELATAAESGSER